jgi:tetratricopeptide (TPR) repeat protein
VGDAGAGRQCPPPGPEAGPAWGNDLSGTVHGPVVQARSIHGDVVFNLAPPPRMPVPGQLLPAPQNFTGRAEELAGLRGLVADQDTARPLTLAVISGVGGVGKTSLALRWLHDVRDRYPAGQLYADLGGHQLGAAEPPGDVLGQFLRSLGLAPEDVPVGLAEQAGVWRSLTDGRRLAILLDNAASAAQVRTLLPGPGPSLVAVTTRWRIGGLAIDGARFTELGPLDEADAVELLDRVVGGGRARSEPQAARSVVRLCGLLPLAVCVSGARLAPRPRWPVERMAAELSCERNRLAALHVTEDLSVRAAFDVSYQALPADAARAYRLLALVPGPDFGLRLAAAAIAAPPDQASRLLVILAESSLLDETGEEVFRFHDLVRLHARGRADAEETEASRLAVVADSVGWYLEAVVAADLVVTPARWRLNPMYEQARARAPSFGGSAQALEWLDSRLPGVLAALRAAGDHALHEQAWQLCEALWGLFMYRKLFGPWIDSHVLGLASARACGDRKAEARMRVQLGYAYYGLRRYGEAADQFTSALALSREDGHELGEGTALEYLALVDLRQGRHDAAIEGFSRARVIFGQIGVSRGVALMTRHIGESHLGAGRYPEAIRDLHAARGMFAAQADRYMEARTLTTLAQGYLQSGQPGSAAGPLNEALAIAADLGAQHEEARAPVALADAAGLLGDRAQERAQLTAALAIYAQAGAPEADEIRCRLDAAGPEVAS